MAHIARDEEGYPVPAFSEKEIEEKIERIAKAILEDDSTENIDRARFIAKRIIKSEIRNGIIKIEE